MLVYAPLLRWYIDHGVEITAVHRTINYQPKTIFTWFLEQVTEERRTGDTDKSKALLADVFKLLGNSAYGKLIEALERQTNVVYTKDEKVVDRALRSAFFSDLEEIGEAYELEKPEAAEGRSKSASRCTSWPSSECSSFTLTSWTSSWTAVTLS